MADIPTIAIGELAPHCPGDEAISSWCGSAELMPAPPPWPMRRIIELPNQAGAAWRFATLPETPLRPVGCAFLRDVEVCGSGYLFHAGKFVREFAHTSDVALQWLGNQESDDNPLTAPKRNRVAIEEPALVVFGPGHRIFGHWLLDFLPRIVVAQRMLGAALDGFILPLPSDTPDWVPRMLHYFCGIEASRIREYSRMDDVLVCRQVCLPSFAHNGNYDPHPLMRAFYSQFGTPVARGAKRRICISRRNAERETHSAWRIFETREVFERMAEERGFEIVQPEALSFADQIALFRSAACVLGESGSGMHAALFADPGTIVANVRFNMTQYLLGRAFEHRSITMTRIRFNRPEPGKPFRFSAAPEDLASLFEVIDRVQGVLPHGA